MRLIESEARRLKVIVNTFVLALAFYGYSKGQLNVDRTSFFEKFMIEFFAPVQQSLRSVQDKITQTINHYVDNVNASKENIELRKRISNYEGQIFTYDEMISENKRLRELLEFGEIAGKKKIVAQVVAWDSSSDLKVLRINRGYNHGVRLQSTVATGNGLVGYIYRLTNNYADVLTILDPNNRTDGIITRIRSHGVIEGYTDNKCLMKYVTRTEPVVLGDEVMTSGLGNLYPKGIKIGTISRIIKETYGITQTIELKPSVEFSTLEEVVIFVSEELKTAKKEWDILDKSSAEEGR